MARVLIVAVAVLLGAASVWFFISTVPLATVTDEPSAGSNGQDGVAGVPENHAVQPVPQLR